MVPISLFPLPGCVSFPGTFVPLHIFEPRYRQMVRESVQERRPIGVCHVTRRLSEEKKFATPEESLSSNHASYEPCAIFSAGPAEITDIHEDGRLMVRIEMTKRYRIVEEIQSVPYRIAICEEIPDEPEVLVDADAMELKVSVLEELSRLSGGKFDDLFLKSALEQLPTGEFSFRIFQFLRFEPNHMQEILETPLPSVRLNLIQDLLKRT